MLTNATPFASIDAAKGRKLLGYSPIGQTLVDILTVTPFGNQTALIREINGQHVVDIKLILQALGRPANEWREVRDALTDMGVPRNLYPNPAGFGGPCESRVTPYGAPIKAVTVLLDDFVNYYSLKRPNVYGRLLILAAQLRRRVK